MFMRMRKRVGWITLVAFVASAVLGVVVDRAYAAMRLREHREQVRAVLRPFANDLAAAVGRRVAQISGLGAFVESRPDFATLEREFASFSAGLLGSGSSLRAVELVRGDHIALIHPMAGNELAMGINLRTDARDEVRADFLRAISTDSVVLSGPLRLVQGDSGLIIRQRVHTRFAGQSDHVALVLDMRILLAEVDFAKPPGGIGVQLYERRNRLVASTPDAVPDDPVSLTVELRDGNWELRGGPSAGWAATTAPRLLPLRVAIVAIVLLVTLLAALLDDRDARLKREVEQRTASIMELVEERSETIRQQQKTEESLAANAERLRLALAAARMGTFELDVPTGRLRGSARLGVMHGLAVGASFSSLVEVLAVISEPDREMMLREYERARREPTTGAMEYRTVGQDGGVRWIGLTWLSRGDSSGVVQRIVGTLTDITERKNLEEQFLHAQKMQAVGVLAGGIAHDFNNLLTVILGAGQIARTEAEALPGTASVRADLDEVLAAGERAAVLTGQLLAFSRRQVIQPRLFDVCELVGGMTSMLKRLVGERVSIVTALPGTPMRVFADQGQLTQVLMNLAVNARDAMPTGGRLQIKVQSSELTEANAPSADGLAPGRYAVLSVTDTGSGIDPAIQHLVFDPFFTTKPVGHGTGLGLSTVYGIVVQLGGAVRLSSEPDVGTTIDVYLPLAERAAAPAPESDLLSATPPGGEGRTLLVAEDEPGLQRLVARVLTNAGYRVLMAEDGAAALGLARAHDGDIALLISDVVMPKMGGLELASVLLQERPGMRALFMSGYPQDMGRDELATLSNAVFLAKPFTPRELLEAVQRALAV